MISLPAHEALQELPQLREPDLLPGHPVFRGRATDALRSVFQYVDSASPEELRLDLIANSEHIAVLQPDFLKDVGLVIKSWATIRPKYVELLGMVRSKAGPRKLNETISCLAKLGIPNVGYAEEFIGAARGKAEFPLVIAQDLTENGKYSLVDIPEAKDLRKSPFLSRFENLQNLIIQMELLGDIVRDLSEGKVEGFGAHIELEWYKALFVRVEKDLKQGQLVFGDFGGFHLFRK